MVKVVNSTIFALVLSVLFSTGLRANTINAASCSAVDVQAAINLANNGDTVLVPGGNCTWSSKVSVNNAITLNGQGKTTITWGTSGSLTVTANTSTNTFVTGFSFVGSQGSGGDSVCPIVFNTAYSPQSQTFRFYNNNLDDGSPSSPSIMMCINGTGPGLIDHNTFTAHEGADEVIHNLGQGASDPSGWTTDLTPGGSNMIFIETNTFTYTATGNPAYFWGTSAVQAFYGARTVFRYNNVAMMQIDVHGTCGNISGRWWEVYNNSFSLVANANQSNFSQFRGGSGVSFNNHESGTNLGGGSIEVTQDCQAGTYPITGQVGRGISQNASPAYLWANDASMPVSNGNPNYLQVNRDYFSSSSKPATLQRCQSAADVSAGCPVSYTYAPYPYPHPLINGSQASFGPPTQLNATVN